MHMHATPTFHSEVLCIVTITTKIPLKVHQSSLIHSHYICTLLLINPLRTVVSYMLMEYEIRYLRTNCYNFVILRLIYLKKLAFSSLQPSECSYISDLR